MAHDCLVACYLMAKTPLVLGSHTSSFAEMAPILSPKTQLETHVDKPKRVDFEKWMIMQK
jgi:hypothetical protein